MTRGALRALAAGPALFFVSGCCCFIPAEAETVVVVVPSRHDGHIGAVVVGDGDDKQLLNTAYASARSGGTGKIRTVALKQADVEEMRRTFAAASEALPERAETYKLYFDLASDNLTPESSQMLENVLDEVARRAAAEVIVTGHSDTLGSLETNEALSLRRAERVRDMIVARGVDTKLVTAVGRGKSELEIETGEDVEEVRNRRVEITVR
jgi:outer membrane protein OmpA-like peptidoglycan-associated protein